MDVNWLCTENDGASQWRGGDLYFGASISQESSSSLSEAVDHFRQEVVELCLEEDATFNT